jgi:tripartite-type tricarboxylate transporter receptor subunit TctC
MKPIRKLACLAGGAALASAMAIVPANADSVADYYKGKTVTMYIGYSAGGGYDVYARTLARHIGDHIPGHPTLVAKNVTGAGSLVLANQMYNAIPKNGLAIAMIGRGLPTEPLFGNKKAKYDPRKFAWIGSMNNEVSVCAVWHTVPVNVWEDLRTRGMIVGGTGSGSDTDTFPTVLNNVLGTKMKLITGYPGGNDINFAIEKGELEGRCGWSWSSVVSTRGSWLKEKKIRILLQISTAKHPDLPDVPLALDLARTPKERQVMKLIFSRQVWGRPFFTTPGVPADRVAALRKAFDETMKDPKFRADTEKQKLEINPVAGESVQKDIAELYESPPDVVQAAVRATTYTGNIQISKAVIPIVTVKGTIDKLDGEHRKLSWKGEGKKGKLTVSGRDTEITLAGKKASRKALKEGLSCAFTYQGSAAKKIVCD